MRSNIELLGNIGGDMAAATAYRHPAFRNIGNNNDDRPEIGQAFSVLLFKIIYAQPAFTTCQAQLTAPPFPGKNIIINDHSPGPGTSLSNGFGQKRVP
jgi:hypothetical protein